MICERIDLYNYFGIKRPQGAEGYLDTYIRKESAEFSLGRKRPAMLVIPGGGYAMVSAREGCPIALEYLTIGFHSFVLNYSVAPLCYPTQLIEAGMAMAWIRENAEKYLIDANHVAAIGFSAGGHLCGMLATMFEEKELVDALGEKAKLCRPDGVILSYPVISAGEFAHRGSFNNLSGLKPELYDKLSLEKRVTEKSSPAFIWSTSNDLTVPCENSLLMALAYRKVGIPIELHIIEPGRHGLSTCDAEVNSPESTVRAWINLSKTWLVNRGFVITNKE